MTKSNLTKEVRADYTGKLVTRHVKTAGAENTSVSKAPKVGSGKPDISTLRKNIAQSLSISVMVLNPDLRQRDRLELLAELTSKHDFSADSKSVVDSFTRMTRNEDFRNCVDLLDRNFDTAGAALSGTSPIDISYAPAIITGLNMFDFEMSAEQEKTVVEATCRILAGGIMDHATESVDATFPNRGEIKMNSTIGGGFALRDDLAQYLAENPEQMDYAVRIVTEIGVSDPKAIVELMNSTIPALLDGFL